MMNNKIISEFKNNISIISLSIIAEHHTAWRRTLFSSVTSVKSRVLVALESQY